MYAGLAALDLVRFGLDPRELDTAMGQAALGILLQRAWTPPADRYVLPPHVLLEGLETEITRHEGEQLVASLAELDRAPRRVTVGALFFTAYTLVVHAHIDLAERVTDDLQRLADDFDSRIAGSYAANLRSMIAADLPR